MAENKIRKFLEDLGGEKVLECSICLKRFQQPKALNCLHSFCTSCLYDWVKTKGELICPICLETYPIPDGGLEKLPQNTFFNYLIQQMGERQICEYDCCEIGKKATHYCQECRQYICSTCYGYHAKFRAHTNHILYRIEDVRSSFHHHKYQSTEFKNHGTGNMSENIDCVSVKHSPVLNVEKEGLVNTIKIGKKVTDVVWCDQDDCLLVAYCKNEIFKCKITGEYIGKITLQEGVRVKRMHKMNNDKLAFSDDGNEKCIKICTMDGQVKRKIGKGSLEAPSGVKVNEGLLTQVYATSFFNNGAFKFSFYSKATVKSDLFNKINVFHNGYNDVTFTKDGKLLFLNHIHSRLELFEKEQFSKVLVWPGDDCGKIMKPGGVVVDGDGNIIISSKNKLQLFNSNGKFMKRIDKEEDGILFPWGLTIISYHPKKVALANHDDTSVKIFIY
ncbi:uncharacterized protein LOC117105324 [Anneissia japonica]|uniref:uncharacterized protein LOC117105324 n=1 Tax=Anneissia japonica TaxID=1529436 RepID=UPI0014258403|nr:uncharacterized protein LOC117105324 [Anneissia japonica]